jgi:hypothetical protein
MYAVNIQNRCLAVDVREEISDVNWDESSVGHILQLVPVALYISTEEGGHYTRNCVSVEDTIVCLDCLAEVGKMAHFPASIC